MRSWASTSLRIKNLIKNLIKNEDLMQDLIENLKENLNGVLRFKEGNKIVQNRCYCIFHLLFKILHSRIEVSVQIEKMTKFVVEMRQDQCPLSFDIVGFLFFFFLFFFVIG